MGLTKAQLEALNDSSFPNNNAGAITPAILRDYNDAVIVNTVNQDVYLTDSASFDSRIDGLATTSSLNSVSTSVGLLQTFSGSQYKADSASFSSRIEAVTGSGGTVNTGSLLVTASAAGNTITFTKGDSSTFNVSVSGGNVDTSSLVTTASFNTYTSSQDFKNTTFATTSSVTDLSSSLYFTDTTQSVNIASNSSSIGLLQTFSGSQYKNDSSSFDSRILAITSSGGNISVQDEGSILGNATSFNFIGAGVTASVSAGTASITIAGGGGSIDTGSFATTGSNTFIGDQSISGSVSIINSANGEIDTLKILPYISSSTFNGNRDTIVTARLANSTDGVTYTPSAPSPTNLIFGSTSTTVSASSIVSGSNNIITAGRFSALNGAEIEANNSYIGTFPSTRIPAYAPVRITNCNLNGPIAITNNSVGLSSSLAAGSLGFGNGLGGQVNNSAIFGVTTLNPNSSSITLNSLVNAGSLTINGNKTGPGFTGGAFSLFTLGNLINVGNTTLVDISSGSNFSGNTSWSRNLFGGVVTATNIGSTTASAGLQNTIAFGSNLIVTGSDNQTGAGNGGSAFFGRYNLNDGTINNTSNVVFAVGAGTGTGVNTRTPLWVGTNQSVNITGSLTVNGTTVITGSNLSINSNADITASTILLNGSGQTAIQYSFPSTGSVLGEFATSYGKDSIKVYQYQGQPYAFNVNLTANQLNAYTGSEFQWGLQTNGTLSLPGGGSTYFNMSSGSNTGSAGDPGANKKGLDYLGTAMVLDMRADTTFDRSVYIDKGMYVSQSVGGSQKPALTANGTNAGGNKAIVATGSVDITGSLTLNGNQITSLAAGAFYSTITQSGSAAVSQSMTFNNTDINEGVSVNSNTQLTVTNAGTYNIQFSAQLLADTGADTVWVWLKKNGTNVSNTAGKLELANNAETMAAWNYLVNANSNDYFELVWESLNGDAVILYETASGNYPAVPSVIVTVTQVN